MSQSVVCPSCQGKVRVADGSGGQEVACPKCQSRFTVPDNQITTESTIDDDWLTLDSDLSESTAPTSESGGKSSTVSKPPGESKPPGKPIPVPPPATASEPKPATPAMHAPQSGDDFDDLPEFSMAPEAPRRGGPPSISLDDFDDDDFDDPGTAKAPTATSAAVQQDYVASCSTCGSRIDVNAKQAGKQVRCPDCYSTVLVPPPPKVRTASGPGQIKSPSLKMQGYNDGPPKVRDDPFRRSAQELLRDAEAMPDDEDTSYRDPDYAGWFRSNYGIFREFSVLAHAAVLAFVSTVAVAIALSSGFKLALAALFPMGVLFAAALMAYGFAVLQAVANEEDTVEEWPQLADPTEWLGSAVFCIVAAALAGAPAAVLGHFLFGFSMVTTAMVMFSLFALFPFILLSMLDMQSVLVPFSPEVSRSFHRGGDAWGVFYVTSGGLFITALILMTIGRLMPVPMAAAVTMTTVVFGTFLYFAMLGNLARQISLNVNDQAEEDEKPT